MRKDIKRDHEKTIREVRARRKFLLEKKARRERRKERLGNLFVLAYGLSIGYVFFGKLGLAVIGIYAFIRYFIVGANGVFGK